MCAQGSTTTYVPQRNSTASLTLTPRTSEALDDPPIALSLIEDSSGDVFIDKQASEAPAQPIKSAVDEALISRKVKSLLEEYYSVHDVKEATMCMHDLAALGNVCAVLCCAVLCCAVMCCAVMCCAVLCCAVFIKLSMMRLIQPFLFSHLLFFIIYASSHFMTGPTHVSFKFPYIVAMCAPQNLLIVHRYTCILLLSGFALIGRLLLIAFSTSR